MIVWSHDAVAPIFQGSNPPRAVTKQDVCRELAAWGKRWVPKLGIQESQYNAEKLSVTEARRHLKWKTAELCMEHRGNAQLFWWVESFYSRAFLWTPAVSYSCIPRRQLLFVLPSTVLNLSRWLSQWKVSWDCPGNLCNARRGWSLDLVCGGYSFLAKIVSFDDVLRFWRGGNTPQRSPSLLSRPK